METSNVGGTKRKLKENAFTAKAESGTLKVKILRRDQRPVDPLTSSTDSSLTPKTRTRRTAKQPPPEANSPPKPRPNRKHVPIFYEEQFRQPIKRGGSHSSTDESITQSTSSTAVQSSTSTEVSGAASTSSTTSSFVAQLSDVRLDSSTSGGDVEVPPRANPLFVRNDSDGLGTLGELLRPYFPSGSTALKPSFPLGETKFTGTTSSAGLLADQTAGLSSALYQLASSSASYRSALDELSTANHAQQSTTGSTDKSTSATVSAATATTTTASTGMETYRFDPLAALQTAIDHARRTTSTNGKTDEFSGKREIGSPNSNARYYRLEPSESHNEKASTSASLDAPPELPPAFTFQNSLVGGGIQRLISPKPSPEEDKIIESSSSSPNDDSSTKDAIAALGPPPDAPPSFLLSNSLTGGGISVLNLPKSHPTFDRLGSLTRLISQANETAKDLNTTLSSPPKTHVSLDRLVSLTSVTSEDGETTNCTNTMPDRAAPEQGTSSSSPTTTHETESSSGGSMDLGPPPSGPPAFTIGNSLMGGGIELQPAAANVNTRNFDWKLHKSSSSSGGDVISSSATRGLSHGLRARLERNLTSSENTTDKT